MNEETSTEQPQADVTSISEDLKLTVTMPLSRWNQTLQLLDKGTRVAEGRDVLLIGGSLVHTIREQLEKQVQDGDDSN